MTARQNWIEELIEDSDARFTDVHTSQATDDTIPHETNRPEEPHDISLLSDEGDTILEHGLFTSESVGSPAFQNNLDLLIRYAKGIVCDLEAFQNDVKANSDQPISDRRILLANHTYNKAVFRSEHLPLKLREFTSRYGIKKYSEVMEYSCAVLGIQVEGISDDGSIKITLPTLQHKIKGYRFHLLQEPLRFALSRYVKSNDSFQVFDQATITFQHLYPFNEETDRHDMIRDYDNLESKFVIDVITTFLLADDNMYHIDVVYTSKACDRFGTIVTVEPHRLPSIR